MADEYTDGAKEACEAPSTGSIERRSSDLRRTSSRPHREHREGMGTNGEFPAESDPNVQHDDALDAEVVDQVSERIANDLLSVTRIAPLPEPQELAQYDKIAPALADRIVRMAESSADAANAATNSNAEVNNAIASSIREDGRSVRRGQWMFTVLAVLFLISAVGLALIGNTAFAITMGVLGFLSGFGVLVRPVNSSRWRPVSKEETNGAAE